MTTAALQQTEGTSGAAVGAPLDRNVRQHAWMRRLAKANYIPPKERADRCGTCKHAEPYAPGRLGKLKCRRVGWYVQTGGICDEHERG